MITVLITGVAGYLGNVIAQELLSNCYYKVIGIDSFAYNNQKTIFHLLNHPRFEFHFCDVAFLSTQLIKRADVILPLAAIVGAPACARYPMHAKLINQDLIQDLIGVTSFNQRIIFPNTNSGYGKQGEDICTEESPLEPISVYGRTKCEAEKMVLNRSNSVSLRLATVCGISPRMRFDLLLNDFVSKIHFDKQIELYEGDFNRNFVHIKDVARVISLMIYKDNLEGVFNVGHPDANITKMALARKIVQHYNLGFDCIKLINGRDPDQRNYIVSNNKILRTGFTFKYTLDDAIRQVADLCRLISRGDLLSMRNYDHNKDTV